MERATTLRELRPAGGRRAAAAAAPDECCTAMPLRGPEGAVRHRSAAFREAGGAMPGVRPVGPEPAKLIKTVKNWL